MTASPAHLQVDLRTDSITLPTPEMWDAMRGAELGWASSGEDVLVGKLEADLARLARKEAGLFVLTGSMANLVALMSQTERGDQVLVEASSHILWCEEWALCHIAGLLPRAIRGERGRIDAKGVVEAIEASLYRHRPHTSLLCLENTDNVFGAALTPEHIAEAADAAHAHGVSVHLDGARIFNAQAALGVALGDFLAPVDSALIGINKGLSAPGGAVLVGSSKIIDRCRTELRRIGGASYHQAGIYAAAGLVAVDTMIGRLIDDHRRAQTLAKLLHDIPHVAVDLGQVETNIVVVELSRTLGSSENFANSLASRGVRCYVTGTTTVRFVTHRHITDSDVAVAADAVDQLVRNQIENR